ncbi:MAG: DUF2849 domain-containing protein [Pseudomonadota bacterium]
MTSVRPKLKPETPKTITAWDTATGDVLYMDADQNWSADPAKVGVFTGEDAEAAMVTAKSDEGRVTDPYFMEVTAAGEITGRETIRERIRAEGPTVHPQFAKSRGA